MPVIVEPDGWPLWLGDVEGDAKALLHPAGDVLHCWPVSRRVNNPANTDARLLEPV